MEVFRLMLFISIPYKYKQYSVESLVNDTKKQRSNIFLLIKKLLMEYS